MAQNDDTGQIKPQVINTSNSNVQPTEEAAQTIAQVSPKRSSLWSIVLLVLLLMTFFTPLGSTLFLPIVLVGLAGAVWHTQSVVMKAPKGTQTPQKFIFTALKLLIIIGVVIVIGIVSIIGLFFLLVGTGTVEIDFGS